MVTGRFGSESGTGLGAMGRVEDDETAATAGTSERDAAAAADGKGFGGGFGLGGNVGGGPGIVLRDWSGSSGRIAADLSPLLFEIRRRSGSSCESRAGSKMGKQLMFEAPAVADPGGLQAQKNQ